MSLNSNMRVIYFALLSEEDRFRVFLLKGKGPKLPNQTLIALITLHDYNSTFSKYFATTAMGPV